ncbi:DUF1294 domain-containing protein [Neptuniibacter halophilus]|uniref:DUF1294 domain-containing protein n=1 Tax=Neptuniibacter halophilus TaxID=651666 RepID=UPI002574668F|nr:DUF1294 domain-containing protein [Neptuniibacter halophilus]
MKHQGKIANWNDAKGYGFVEPHGGGTRSFVHIKAFRSSGRRPVDGDIIVYESVRGSDGRHTAKNIRYASDRLKTAKSKPRTSNRPGLLFTALFCSALLISSLLGQIPGIILSIYFAASLIAFLAYALDKSAAQKGQWRTQESTLHLFSLLGGWPGAYLARQTLRHKSSKREFIFTFWITVILNLAGLSWLISDNGIRFIEAALG